MHAPVSSSSTRASTGSELTVRYLDDQDVTYKLLDHDERFSAAAEARACGIAPHNAAKAILLCDGGEYRLAVIPASELLDVKKLRDLIDAGGPVRLASEEEMAADFPAFEIGALPPLGFMLGVPEAIDARVLEHRRVLCNAGDHRHSMLIDPRDVADLGDVRIGDICQD